MALTSNISISAHPQTGLIRKVDVDKIIINGGERYVKLVCTVHTYDSNGNEVLPSYPVSLNATDEFWVNNTGAIVDAADPAAWKTEYDYYMYIKDNVTAKIQILELDAVAKADASGKFNL